MNDAGRTADDADIAKKPPMITAPGDRPRRQQRCRRCRFPVYAVELYEHARHVMERGLRELEFSAA